jgi:hypothetical protein
MSAIRDGDKSDQWATGVIESGYQALYEQIRVQIHDRLAPRCSLFHAEVLRSVGSAFERYVDACNEDQRAACDASVGKFIPKEFIQATFEDEARNAVKQLRGKFDSFVRELFPCRPQPGRLPSPSMVFESDASESPFDEDLTATDHEMLEDYPSAIPPGGSTDYGPLDKQAQVEQRTSHLDSDAQQVVSTGNQQR